MKKHARAAFVQCNCERDPVSYSYGPRVAIAEGTDFTLLLKALVDGKVVYDPGIKIVDGRGKKRSQFRASFRNLAALYHSVAHYEI